MITAVPVTIEPNTHFLAVRWNAPPKDAAQGAGRPRLARECNDHPSVRPTSYDEVSAGLGTCGCSKDYPWWTHNVMGVIDSQKGKLFVSPGDWVISMGEGQHLVLSDTHYNEFFRSAT